ncbi:MAG: MBL fold metallo-hydrolase [Clostridiales bacterium]|nr:MBL fold metallo-hydrolase [Clostridiales bacterium]
MKITFCGAAESVTGSCHLVEREEEGAEPFLLDCGQFQGSAKQEAQNYEPFMFDPANVGFLILSHAHIDHCGRIPLLVKRGFQGRIYCTDSTADLLPVMLRDSAHIHEIEAEWKNRKARRAGKAQVEPLYRMADAEAALAFITPVHYEQEISPTEGVRFSFVEAGHILGSAVTVAHIREGDSETKLVYTGDLGGDSKPLLRDPVKMRQADIVIMETTYGARLHDRPGPAIEKLAEIIERTAKRGGTVLIPSFAVGRTQELIYELNEHYDRGGDKGSLFNFLKVYIDSPMAQAATEIFRRNIQDFNDEYKAQVMAGDDPLDFEGLVFTRTTDESKALNADMAPKIIISASGMCEAGRIRHHLKHRLWDPRSTVVFVGYQAEGTLGRRLVDGAKTVTLFGDEIGVSADVISLEGFSSHADRDGLLQWVKGFDAPPDALFLVHGEAGAKAAFAETLRAEAGLEAIVIEEVCSYTYEPGGKAGEQGPEGIGGAAQGVDPEEMERMLAKLRDINDNVEGLLYRAKLAAQDAASGGDMESYAALKNIIASLDSDTSKLAGELAGRKKGIA